MSSPTTTGEGVEAGQLPATPTDDAALGRVLQAVMLAADQPLSLDRLQAVFDDDQAPDKAALRDALSWLEQHCRDGAVELVEVGSGWRLQVRQAYAPWVSRLWREKPQRYSRALLETLAIICYRQPLTRGEIEEIRGVSLSQTIVRTLLERAWVREVGHREVPGRPALLGTTRQFLDDFNLRSLDQLPALPEIKDLDALHAALAHLEPGGASAHPTDDAASADDDDAAADTMPEQASAATAAPGDTDIDRGNDVGADVGADVGVEGFADSETHSETDADEGSDDDPDAREEGTKR